MITAKQGAILQMLGRTFLSGDVRAWHGMRATIEQGSDERADGTMKVCNYEVACACVRMCADEHSLEPTEEVNKIATCNKLLYFMLLS